MCRFLLFQSKKSIDPQPLVCAFANMAEKSRAFDGDWQGDGWGISWLDANNHWKSYRSLKPVWQDVQSTNRLDIMTKTFAIHARSASFEHHKNVAEYNQPFVNNQYVYVFNGLLKGVTLPLPGTIGSQKIWYLLHKKLGKYPPEKALIQVEDILQKNCREVQAANIGIADKNSIYAVCRYSKLADYYQLHFVDNLVFKMICSEELPGYDWHTLQSNTAIKL